MAAVRADQVAQPLVFLGADLAPGQPLVQDALRVVTAARGARLAGEVGDHGVGGPDQQAPEHDHPEPHQPALPPGPIPAVPEHHHDHLLPGPVCRAALAAAWTGLNPRVGPRYGWGAGP